MDEVTTYHPPCTITPRIVRAIADICEVIGRLGAMEDTTRGLWLRRINRLRTIQGSLAIEGNTLSLEQITAILEGKRVIAPPREIQEVRNAITAYDRLPRWNPEKEADFLEAHKTLMRGLLDSAGCYRQGGVGIMARERVIHVAPSAKRVPALMRDLFEWLKASEHHPLVTSAIFHYELEFIHPFEDGNGRIGRLWQTLILSRWNPIFTAVPVESMVYKRQQDYYEALAQSTSKGDSSPFVEFMMAAIQEALAQYTTPQVTPQVARLLFVLKDEMSRGEIQAALGLKDRKSFRSRYLAPALNAGLIEMTIPERPNSRLQKYSLTEKGRRFVHELQEKIKIWKCDGVR